MRKHVKSQVGVWIGKFPDERSFDHYFAEKFTDDGDRIPSEFEKSFSITVSPYSQEKAFFENTIDPVEEIKSASYSDQYLEKLKTVLSSTKHLEANSICCVFDIETPPKAEEDKYLKFVGMYEYHKTSES
ncbi:immunity 22 family protein [Inquilinus limosus]|uniref:immunity 22 family protein n=1 Tax=Inquilinus limosus TaxID=171674 RepID=UPI003F159D78